MKSFIKYLACSAALIGALTAGTLSYNHEARRASSYPLGFSEIRQIEKDYKEKNLLEGPRASENLAALDRAQLYAGTNDAYMKVFESWNIANESGGNVYEEFQKHLSRRMNPNDDLGYHYNLDRLIDLVDDKADSVTNQLRSFRSIATHVPGIVSSFNASWDENHKHNYHPEIYYVDVTTGTGENQRTHTEMRVRQVYDDTDHSFMYHPRKGNEAKKKFNDFYTNYLNEIEVPAEGNSSLVSFVHLPGQVLLSSKVNPEGSAAAIHSRQNVNSDLEFSDDDVTSFSQAWFKGTTFFDSEQKVYTAWPSFVTSNLDWNEDALSADSLFINTNSKSHPGPQEYQTVKRAVSSGNDLVESINDCFDSVNTARNNVANLESRINEFISLENHDEIKAASKELLTQTKEYYTDTFPKGFDVAGFRGWSVALLSFLGALGSGAITLGAGSYLEKKLNFDEELESSYSFKG